MENFLFTKAYSLFYFSFSIKEIYAGYKDIHRGETVITIAQLNSTTAELKFCTGSNPTSGVSEIHDGEDL